MPKESTTGSFMFQITQGVRFGSIVYIMLAYLIPQILSQLRYIYISVLFVALSIFVMKDHMDIDDNPLKRAFTSKSLL